MSVSILILTLNEERNLPACLQAIGWCDDIVVYDSFSSDRTVEIAKASGARVVQRRFDNYGNQREAARKEVAYKYPWVLALDADEAPDQELTNEILNIAALPTCQTNAFRMRRKDYFMGRWIKHSTLYPSWFIRLYKPSSIRYERRSVHEYPMVDGQIGELRGHLTHQSFNKGLGDWIRKHVRYAELEATENIRQIQLGTMDWLGLFAGDEPVRKRRALKSLSCYLPFRPTLRFLYMYVLRMGMLDGHAGLTYCRLLAIYEYLIVLQTKELKRREQGLPV